jgi:hypothetical protein
MQWRGVECRRVFMFALSNCIMVKAFSPNFDLGYQRTHLGLSALPTDMLSLAPEAPLFVTHLLSNFDVESHPVATILGSYMLVTASDMVPFVPCQPLAVALGAKLGVLWAFPITAAGQTTAGLLAFSVARRAADSDLVREANQARSGNQSQIGRLSKDDQFGRTR